MIFLSGVTKTYRNGALALRGVSLHIKQGEFVVLLGPSGAGKSTLLRVINGLVTPCRGKGRVDGLMIGGGKGNLRELRRRVGMIFQQFNLIKRMTVLDNVLCGRLAYVNPVQSSLRLFSPADVALAKECLNRVGLAGKAFQRVDQLSGGQQQRVGIARALMQRPKVILADEPVASLDPVSAERVMELLAQVNREDGITVVVSLHDVDLALKYAQRVIGVSTGQVVIDKPVADVTEEDLAAIYQPFDESGWASEAVSLGRNLGVAVNG